MGATIEAVLVLLPSFESNERFVLTGLHMQSPILDSHVPRVERATQKIDGELSA